MRVPRPRIGFTLVELLIVLAIVVVLAALLVPVVSRLRETALVANCASNLRQIGQAAHAYRADHMVFPDAAIMPPPFRPPLDTRRPIFDVLDPYLPPASAVYRCPGDATQVYARCVAASPARPGGVSYVYWGPQSQTFPTGSLAKNLIMWEYAGDSLHGLIAIPFHRGGNFLAWDGSVELRPSQER